MKKSMSPRTSQAGWSGLLCQVRGHGHVAERSDTSPMVLWGPDDCWDFPGARAISKCTQKVLNVVKSPKLGEEVLLLYFLEIMRWKKFKGIIDASTEFARVWKKHFRSLSCKIFIYFTSIVVVSASQHNLVLSETGVYPPKWQCWEENWWYR